MKEGKSIGIILNKASLINIFKVKKDKNPKYMIFLYSNLHWNSKPDLIIKNPSDFELINDGKFKAFLASNSFLLALQKL
ncbi:MAG: hypothetical protein EAX96_06120 [Candidatus Lokiarchaeota archaeon]|nr:hypothetical protein [Candidatus Lokiarchaeota archaeon]